MRELPKGIPSRFGDMVCPPHGAGLTFGPAVPIYVCEGAPGRGNLGLLQRNTP
jgi:hypothetical protein